MSLLVALKKNPSIFYIPNVFSFPQLSLKSLSDGLSFLLLLLLFLSMSLQPCVLYNQA